MKVGDVVEWRLTLCGRRYTTYELERGIVSRIVDGRVYVAASRTNLRGRKKTRVCEFWWDPHEVGALRVVADACQDS